MGLFEIGESVLAPLSALWRASSLSVFGEGLGVRSRAIEFDAEFFLCAVEVEYKRSDAVLAAEFKVVEFAVAHWVRI